MSTQVASHLPKIGRVLIVEDDPKDMLDAADALRAIGISAIDGTASSCAARTSLEKGLRGELSLPDAIVLDLDLGQESGYELLRFWHCTAQLASIPVIVWSRLPDNHKAVCEAFKVSSYVSKHDGMRALREALEELRAA